VSPGVVAAGVTVPAEQLPLNKAVTAKVSTEHR
jgi:hypothetical protein